MSSPVPAPGQDHDEFVAPKPDAEVGRAAGVAHALRGQDKHVVARGMAQRVVDLLEAVEVELEHGEPFAAPVRALDQRVEMVGEEGAVVQARQSVMHGNEGHRVARIDQLVRAAQDHLGHRPEDEQGYHDDDGDGRVEQRPVDVERLLQSLRGDRVDARAEFAIAGKRRVRDGFVELRPLLAGEIARPGFVRAELGLYGRDEAPAIGGQTHRKKVEVEGLGKKHVLDRGRIVARRRSGVGASAVEKLVVVLLEFGGRPFQRGDQLRLVTFVGVVGRVGEEHDALRQRFLRAHQRKQRLIVLLLAHHLLQQHVGRHHHGGDDQQRHPVCAFDDEDQPVGADDRRLLRHLLPQAPRLNACFDTDLGAASVNFRKSMTAGQGGGVTYSA